MISKPQAVPLNDEVTPEQVANTSRGYILAVIATITFTMAQWLDAQIWLPFTLSHESVHFWTGALATFCGISLSFLPALRRRVSK